MIERQHLRAADVGARDDVCTFVRSVFRSADFRPWFARGGWTDDYEMFVLRESGRLVATVGRTRMRLSIAGREGLGYQLGAVATAPDARGRGLSRVVMDWVLAESGDAPMLLFANANVLDYYTKFGFRRMLQQRYAAAADLQPGGLPARVLDVDDPADRDMLAAHCAQAMTLDTAFGTRDYYGTLLWHLGHPGRRTVALPEHDAIAVVRSDGDCLQLHDLFAVRTFDLGAVAARLVDAPVSRIEFGFNPRGWWPSAQASGFDPEPLFVRGAPELIEGSLRLPVLSVT